MGRDSSLMLDTGVSAVKWGCHVRHETLLLFTALLSAAVGIQTGERKHDSRWCSCMPAATQTHTQSTVPKSSNTSYISASVFARPLAYCPSYQRRLGKHRQRLRPLSGHHARLRGCARRSNAGVQGNGGSNERRRPGGQRQCSSHLKLHGGGGSLALKRLLKGCFA